MDAKAVHLLLNWYIQYSKTLEASAQKWVKQKELHSIAFFHHHHHHHFLK